MLKLQVKKLTESAIIPTQGSNWSAGYDLYSIENHILMPMNRKLFKTGLSIGIPTHLHGRIYGRIAPRSGLAHKDGLDVLAGVIDEDYRGEIGVILINFGQSEKEIKIGDKIAQIIFEFYNKVDWELVEDLTQTQRGTGGFGSTDAAGKPAEGKKIPTLSPILDKFAEVVKNEKPVTYSERMQERMRS